MLELPLIAARFGGDVHRSASFGVFVCMVLVLLSLRRVVLSSVFLCPVFRVCCPPCATIEIKRGEGAIACWRRRHDGSRDCWRPHDRASESSQSVRVKSCEMGLLPLCHTRVMPSEVQTDRAFVTRLTVIQYGIALHD